MDSDRCLPIIKRKWKRVYVRPLQNRLTKIADILERHDAELIAVDGPIPQEPSWLREIYLLAKGDRARRK